MKYMLDTNICIYALKGGDAALDARLAACETGDLVMSMITLGELEIGFAKSGDVAGARAAAAEILADVPALDFDKAAARAFGELQAAAPSKRGAYDRLIAAHAFSLELTVVTNNEQDFENLPGLMIENWTHAP